MKKRHEPPGPAYIGQPLAGKTSGPAAIRLLLDSDPRLFPASQLPPPGAPNRRRAKKKGGNP